MASRQPETAAPSGRDFWGHLARRADWDVTAAAQHLGISLRQLERLCQEQLGCAPRECFQRERMAEAARLLASCQSVKIVAMQLGYTQPANFSRDFKRHFGRTPRAFVPRLLLGLPSASPASGQERGLKG